MDKKGKITQIIGAVVDVNFDGKPVDYKDLMIALTFPEL